MNKEKFMTELREYLDILEEEEREDILAEYAQHIDMKMRKGLSEEEAISDFGPMQELAAEILEAYHVNPEFRKKGSEHDIKIGLPSLRLNKAEDGESFGKRGLRWIREKLAGTICGIRHGLSRMAASCRAAAGRFIKLFTGRKDGVIGKTEEKGIHMEETRKKKGQIGRACRVVGDWLVALWKGFTVLCIFCLKMMWNAGWLMFALLCACMAMIVLMGVGTIAVLLLQGYPLIGIFMICLGGLLCLGTLCCGAFSLLIRKREDDGNEEAEKFRKEVQYEQTA